MQRSPRDGERGIAVVLTSLVLVPLMIFAAFGVDLASWHARISEIQRAADAAALAGAVWMPNMSTATTAATESLRSNGIVHGVDSMEVQIEEGSTSTSLRVTVTDTNARRFFSQFVSAGPQRLSRSAEAEYNLPLPLGSPLNYFGGDFTRTASAPVIPWPSDYSSRSPANAACNVGTSAGQGLGRWSSSSSFTQSDYNTGNPQCSWTVLRDGASGASAVPPPDYPTRSPNNVSCRVYADGTTSGAQLGRWTGSGFSTSTSGSSTPCSWSNSTTDLGSRRPNDTTTAPTNQPCRIGYGSSDGQWSGGTYSTPATINGGSQTSGNRLCRWTADLSSITAGPNPIDASRSPGFWAAVEGPQTNAYQGDIYSTRCYGGGPGCSGAQNQQFKSGGDRGFWYAIKIPAGLTGSVTINVFDAAYVAANTNTRAGDRHLDGANVAFPTQFQVWEQTNPLDFSVRSAVFSSSTPDTAEGSCNWEVEDEAAFSGQWRHLCTLPSVSPGEIYLLNVQTTGTSGAGVNGYAIEAVANGSHSGVQPSLYAYSNMAMQNNNTCTPSPCTPPPATFYLAEVGPQYAGRILVMELWDSGDVGSGVTATMAPMRPSSSVPKPVVPVPAGECTWTADTFPNSRISGVSGSEYTTPQDSDDATNCLIETSTGSGARFNGEWLRIRIEIPSDYTCTPGVNPETTAGSCWWGIRYTFTGSANDVTTWQARIEGNPLQLTQ